MPLPPDKAWFSAKRYGYGWGFPRRWQGWAVMIGYFVALLGARPFAGHNPGVFLAYAFGLTAVLIAICYWKGEPTKWRWGDE